MEPATGYPVPPNRNPHPNGYPPPPPPPASGTAYPYQAPSQPSNPYYYNPQNPPYAAAQRPTVIRRLVGLLIIVTVIVFTILLISWIVIRPRVPEFRLTSFNVTNFNYSSARVSGDWAARFEVYNPNKKMSVRYDPISSYVFYQGESLAQTRMPPFDQQRRNLTVVETRYSTVSNFVDQWVTDEIDKEKRKRGVVTFELRVMAGVGFKVGGFRARRRVLRVRCDDLAVELPGNGGSGKMSRAPKRCLVYA